MPKKIKASIAVLALGLLHFFLMFKVVVDRLTCDIQPSCVGPLNKFAGVVLSFPVGWLTWVIHRASPDVDAFTFVGGELFVFYFVNSMVAAVLIVKLCAWLGA